MYPIDTQILTGIIVCRLTLPMFIAFLFLYFDIFLSCLVCKCNYCMVVITNILNVNRMNNIHFIITIYVYINTGIVITLYNNKQMYIVKLLGEQVKCK